MEGLPQPETYDENFWEKLRAYLFAELGNLNEKRNPFRAARIATYSRELNILASVINLAYSPAIIEEQKPDYENTPAEQSNSFLLPPDGSKLAEYIRMLREGQAGERPIYKKPKTHVVRKVVTSYAALAPTITGPGAYVWFKVAGLQDSHAIALSSLIATISVIFGASADVITQNDIRIEIHNKLFQILKMFKKHCEDPKNQIRGVNPFIGISDLQGDNIISTNEIGDHIFELENVEPSITVKMSSGDLTLSTPEVFKALGVSETSTYEQRLKIFSVTYKELIDLAQKHGENAVPAIREYLERLTEAELEIEGLREELDVTKQLLDTLDEGLDKDIFKIEYETKLRKLKERIIKSFYEIILPIKAAKLMLERSSSDQDRLTSALQATVDKTEELLNAQDAMLQKIENMVQTLEGDIIECDSEDAKIALEILRDFTEQLLLLFNSLKYVYQPPDKDPQNNPKGAFSGFFDDNAPQNNQEIHTSFHTALQLIVDVRAANIGSIAARVIIESTKESVFTTVKNSLTPEQIEILFNNSNGLIDLSK